MIPWGPWHPDKEGVNVPVCTAAINCLPAVNGFKPLPSLAPVSDAIRGTCLGGATVYDDDGDVYVFAGDETKLYNLGPDSRWDDVTRIASEALLDDSAVQLTDDSGNLLTVENPDDYSAGSGERWSFAASGALVIAVNIGDAPQKFLLGSSSAFAALGGTPPQARYIAVVRDFVVLGGLDGDERTIQWSGLANAEHWTPGSQSSDTQTFQNGGPVRGLLGGEVGYVFQAGAIKRMTYAPGSPTIFDIDEIEDGRGLQAPYSLVRVGRLAFYLSADGFYRFNIGGAASEPIGVGKWAKWFLDDLKSGTEQIVIGGVSPSQRFVIWAYNSRDNSGSDLNRSLVYDWALDEATIVDVPIQALMSTLTTGITLDDLDAFGTLDTLPFSLDSPVWRGGAALLGVFGSDSKLSYFAGPNMEAQITTSDGFATRRALIKGARPFIDTRAATVAISAREADGDTITFATAEAMESTGICPAHVSGNLIRAKLIVPEGSVWQQVTGLQTLTGSRGLR